MQLLRNGMLNLYQRNTSFQSVKSAKNLLKKIKV